MQRRVLDAGMPAAFLPNIPVDKRDCAIRRLD
jgi:hypothetical protein